MIYYNSLKCQQQKKTKYVIIINVTRTFILLLSHPNILQMESGGVGNMSAVWQWGAVPPGAMHYSHSGVPGSTRYYWVCSG